MSKNIKRVLVVGGTGYIGGYLVDLLMNRQDFNVIVYDNLLYEFQYLKNVPFIFGDVRNTKRLKDILMYCDVVIWLAGIVGDAACNVDKRLTYEVNVNSVKWLVDNYDGKIIYTSTCSVYGKNDNLLDEDSPVNPLSYYAETKLEAEQYIIKYANNPLIFRLGTLFGQGDNYSRIRFDLVVNIFSLMAARGEPLIVIGKEQWRPIIHVKDVGNAIVHGLINNLHGLYVIHDLNLTLENIAKTVRLYTGASIIYKDSISSDLRNYKVDSKKFRNTGWLPLYTLEDGIYEIINLVQSNRVKYVNNSIYSNANYIKENYE